MDSQFQKFILNWNRPEGLVCEISFNPVICFSANLTLAMIPIPVNLSFCIAAMSVIVNTQTIIHIKFVGKYITCPHTMHHIASSNGSMLTAVKAKAKHKFHAAATTTLLFHIL
jgi:hypothetical protein